MLASTARANIATAAARRREWPREFIAWRRSLPASASRTPRSSRIFVKRDGPDCEIAKLFGAQKEQLAATRPDVIVMFDTDHLNTFFLDSLPIFAVGVDKNFQAPNDEPRDVPNYVVPSAPDLAAHIRNAASRRASTSA